MTSLSIYLIFAILTFLGISSTIIDYPERMVAYLKHMWLYFLFFSVTVVSPQAAIFILALISFFAMREYFTLITIRPQDRMGVLGAFGTIPFMIFALWNSWYQLFIIFILLYSFLGVSFLIVMGGDKSEGTVFSIGVIVISILLFVVGNGHLGFMTLDSIQIAVLVVINICLIDALSFLLSNATKRIFFDWHATKYLVAIPITVTIFLICAPFLSISGPEAAIIATALPIVVAANRYIMIYIEKDLGISSDYETLRRGRLINSSCPLIMTVPIIYQYLSFIAH